MRHGGTHGAAGRRLKSMFPVTCLDLIFQYPVAFIAVILELFLAIGLGVYSGFNIKKDGF